MKRILVAVLLIVSILGIASPSDAQVSLGIKGGTNFAKLGGADAGDNSSITGITGGGYMVVKLSESLSFQPEVLFTQRGTKMTVDQVTDAKFKLGYFEVPMLLRISPPMTDAKSRPHLIAGPSIGFKTSCKVQGDAGSISVDVKCSDPNFDIPLKSTEFGLIAGGGADFNVGRVVVGLDARYYLGLTKIDDSSNPDDVKNRGIGIMLGVRFPLGGTTLMAAR